jgi:hypothetical protein
MTMNAQTENAPTQNATIENALTVVNAEPPAVITDGWDQAAVDMSANPMKGITTVKFDNGVFFAGKEKTLLDPDREYVAIDIRDGWCFLKKETPPEYVMRPLDGPKPPRPESFTNEDEWPIGLSGEPEDPWKYTRFLFLLDPQSAATLVYSTSSFGGAIGIDELAKAIRLMRQGRAGAVPAIKLQSRQWKNRYGTRPRPFFLVTGWHFKEQGGGDLKTVNDMDDTLPF